MSMTPETKSEIIIVAIAGAALILLWAKNRHAGAGTGLEGFPALHDNTPMDAAPGWDIPAPVPGLEVSYQGSPWALPAPGNYQLDAGSLSSCNCAGSGQTGSTFGSPRDLSAWLNSQPAIVNAAREGLQNFY
jgi:hypothetical protein